MTDLTKIDLERLPNIDKSIIPVLKIYFESVMKKEREEKLNCKTDELAEAVLNGKLRIEVPGKNDSFMRDGNGFYGIAGAELGNLIHINEKNINVLVLAHELEHWLNEENMGIVVKEAMAEIGAFYIVGDNPEKVRERLFRKDSPYYQYIHFLLAVFEATGKGDIKLLIEAARVGNKEFFYSFIPEKYMKSISELGVYIHELRMMKRFDDTSAIALLYDNIKEFQEYMVKNGSVYPNLIGNEDIIFAMMESFFDGYKDFLDEQTQRQMMIENIVPMNGSVNQQQVDYIKDANSDCQHSIPEDIELQIYRQMLKERPYNCVFNALVSCYSGYVRFQRLLKKSKEIIGEEEFFILDNIADFLSEYSYVDGEPIQAASVGREFIIVYREKETGFVKMIRDGKDVTQIGENDILTLINQNLDIVGKQLNLDAWEWATREMCDAKNPSGYVFIDSSTLRNKQQLFTEALVSYRDKKTPRTEVEDYIELFQRKQELAESYKEDYYDGEDCELGDWFGDDFFENMEATVEQGGVGLGETKEWIGKIETKGKEGNERPGDANQQSI